MNKLEREDLLHLLTKQDDVYELEDFVHGSTGEKCIQFNFEDGRKFYCTDEELNIVAATIEINNSFAKLSEFELNDLVDTPEPTYGEIKVSCDGYTNEQIQQMVHELSLEIQKMTVEHIFNPPAYQLYSDPYVTYQSAPAQNYTYSFNASDVITYGNVSASTVVPSIDSKVQAYANYIGSTTIK